VTNVISLCVNDMWTPLIVSFLLPCPSSSPWRPRMIERWEFPAVRDALVFDSREDAEEYLACGRLPRGRVGFACQGRHGAVPGRVPPPVRPWGAADDEISPPRTCDDEISPYVIHGVRGRAPSTSSLSMRTRLDCMSPQCAIHHCQTMKPHPAGRPQPLGLQRGAAPTWHG
jgi:hypothetical protein